MCPVRRTRSTSIRFIVLAAIAGLHAIASVAAAQDRDTTAENRARLSEVLVTGAAVPANPTQPQSTSRATQYNLVTDEQLRKQSTKDFGSALRNVPGVMSLSRNVLGAHSGHSLYIRGRGAGHPGADLSVQFDGVPRFGAIYGQVLGDSLPASLMGGVQIHKSVDPAAFGNGYAAVNVLPKRLDEDGSVIRADIAGGSKGTWMQSLEGGARKDGLDYYLVQGWTSTDGHRPHSAAQQENYYVTVGARLTPHWTVRWIGNQTSSRTEDPGNIANVTPASILMRFDTRTQFTTLSAEHSHATSSGYVKAYWNDTDFTLRDELSGGQATTSLQDIRLYGVRAREIMNPWSGARIIAGIDLDYTATRNTQRWNDGSRTREWEFPDMRLISPYLSISQDMALSGGWTATPSLGVRHYDHDQFGSRTAPQAGLRIGNGRTEFRAAWAKGVNYPSPVILQGLVETTGAPIADPEQYWQDLEAETVTHHEIGFTHQWSRQSSVGASVFKDSGRNRILQNWAGAVPRGNETIGRYDITGIELNATVQPSRDWTVFAGATWLQVRAAGRDGVTAKHMPYTPKFMLQGGAQWKGSNGWQLSLDMQHIRGLYQGTYGRGADIPAPPDTNRLDDVTLVNARVDVPLAQLWDSTRDVNAYVSVGNLFGERYELAIGYPMPRTTLMAGLHASF